MNTTQIICSAIGAWFFAGLLSTLVWRIELHITERRTTVQFRDHIDRGLFFLGPISFIYSLWQLAKVLRDLN